jgi:prophage antirepressor-like protein
MKLARWSFQNLHIPMLEDEQGSLYCINQALTSALGLTEASLRKLYFQHKGEFDGNCVTSSNAIQFLREHKTEFGLRYVRGDMRLWSENDMILIAVLSRSPVGSEFRKGVIQLIKDNARKEYISKEQYEADMSLLKGQVQELKDMFQQSQPALHTAASAAGVALQAQRGTKHLRLIK